MKVFITGSSGFIGRRLTQCFLDKGWYVTGTGLSENIFAGHERYTYIKCDTSERGSWQDHVGDADVIINLAGKNIFTPWNRSVKNEIRNSRIRTTKNLVDAMMKKSGGVFLSTSAGGIYGNRGEERLTESTTGGRGFLSELCRDWEMEARKAEEKGARVVLMRFSMILGKEGGALNKMLPFFKLCLGGKLGKGDQWMSWMHIEDLVSSVFFIIENEKINGPVNFCSPLPVKNSDFTKALASAVRRPVFFTLPSFILKTVMGELGSVVIDSQKMIPEKLEQADFIFSFPDLKMALENIINKK